MRAPKFTLNDVKYASDPATFARAEKLFAAGKVRAIREDGHGYVAIVEGGDAYDVSLSWRRVDEGYCSCYMGQNDMLCKHVLATALAVLAAKGGDAPEPLPKDLRDVKRLVAAGMRKLRPYEGPSRIWFSYQRTLSIGAAMIINAVRYLSASRENAAYLWELVVRLSDKLATSGIDDSDGTVGGCVNEIVYSLVKYARERPELKTFLLAHCGEETNFGFGDDLRESLMTGSS